ncbi:MAG TPA: hypothetical protein PK020_03905 [Ilumatobacteraceae bacterium]|nr:hypothetical protein [Ilumatobacteraceae bacterium]
MSGERAWVVGLPAEPTLLTLAGEVRSAAERAQKAEPGDRLDIARFESLATRLEQLAVHRPDAPRTEVSVTGDGATNLIGMEPDRWPRSLASDVRDAARAFVAQGRLPVLIVDPHAVGATTRVDVGAAEEPADAWEAEEGVIGNRAVEARFRAQIEDALNPDITRRGAISPSGINNAIVTETLREFAAAAPGDARVDAMVEYRDGSKSAHPFPLRSLPFVTNPRRATLELRFALLSIRHTEMDAVVHGAWLRNAEVSRPRPAAQTDDLVYDISIKQLEEVCRGEQHVRLDMYQTGLETAVVGFYRAVSVHLMKFPGSVSVQPMYFVAPPKRKQERTDQRSRGGRGDKQRGGRRPQPATPQSVTPRSVAPLITESSTFRKGKLWAT